MSAKLTRSEAKLVMHMARFYVTLCATQKKKQKAVDLYLKLEKELA